MEIRSHQHKRIRQYVKPEYDKNDLAHRLNHADEVYERALEMNSKLGLRVDEDLILCAAYMHDYFASTRSTHHEAGAEFFKRYGANIGKLIGLDLYPIDIENISNAIREHRASWTGAYSSQLSDLIASADRGNILNLGAMLERSYQYGVTKLNLSEDEACLHAHDHIKEKYGRNGYARFPEAFKAFYKNSIEAFHNSLDALKRSVGSIRELISLAPASKDKDLTYWLVATLNVTNPSALRLRLFTFKVIASVTGMNYIGELEKDIMEMGYNDGIPFALGNELPDIIRATSDMNETFHVSEIDKTPDIDVDVASLTYRDELLSTVHELVSVTGLPEYRVWNSIINRAQHGDVKRILDMLIVN